PKEVLRNGRGIVELPRKPKACRKHRIRRGKVVLVAGENAGSSQRTLSCLLRRHGSTRSRSGIQLKCTREPGSTLANVAAPPPEQVHVAGQAQRSLGGGWMLQGPC